jgi:hypothetical protein
MHGSISMLNRCINRRNNGSSVDVRHVVNWRDEMLFSLSGLLLNRTNQAEIDNEPIALGPPS